MGHLGSSSDMWGHMGGRGGDTHYNYTKHRGDDLKINIIQRVSPIRSGFTREQIFVVFFLLHIYSIKKNFIALMHGGLDQCAEDISIKILLSVWCDLP